jgi:hypothetical protein
VVLREPADRDPEALARRIVDATLRALARTI